MFGTLLRMAGISPPRYIYEVAEMPWRWSMGAKPLISEVPMTTVSPVSVVSCRTCSACADCTLEAPSAACRAAAPILTTGMGRGDVGAGPGCG